MITKLKHTAMCQALDYSNCSHFQNKSGDSVQRNCILLEQNFSNAEIPYKGHLNPYVNFEWHFWSTLAVTLISLLVPTTPTWNGDRRPEPSLTEVNKKTHLWLQYNQDWPEVLCRNGLIPFSFTHTLRQHSMWVHKRHALPQPVIAWITEISPSTICK